MIQIEKNDYRLQHAGFYNIYPIWNEVSPFGFGSLNQIKETSGDVVLIDDYYGRIFSPEIYQTANLYGKDENMNYYIKGINIDVVDTLRVPYRKIPIFEITNFYHIPALLKKLQMDNPDYEILLRGQNKCWELSRPEEEKFYLYGNEKVKEPSFLPSYLRSNLDEFFIQSMWINQARILLNDFDYDCEKNLTEKEYENCLSEINYLKNSSYFIHFALGLAQHYGMPSIGLDLTKTIEVATWFATNNINIDENGCATTNPILDFNESIIYIFRCPRLSVFSYNDIRPKVFPVGRPDVQDAWFGHVGWGYAKNQLASYLMCGIKMKQEFLNELSNNFDKKLFPDKAEDYFLDYFIKMKNKDTNEGDVQRVLNKIYALS